MMTIDRWRVVGIAAALFVLGWGAPVFVDMTLAACTPPTITGNPSDQNVTAGQTATYTVTATGDNLIYQWQDSGDGGASWTDIPLGVNPTDSFTTASNQNGWRFRCVVSNGCDPPAVSLAATLTVCTPPTTFSTQPSDWSGNSGSTAVFTIAIPVNVTSPVYQWQRSGDGGSTWNNATVGSGAATASYSFPATAGDNAAKFRCNVSGTCGSTVYSINSSIANCIVCSQPAITVNPSNGSDTAGHTATFSVTASGTPSLSYQWQQSTDGGTNWTDVPAANTSVLSFTAATNQNGWKYHCVVSTGCFTPATSAAATLSVCTPPTITQQPVSQPGKQVGDVDTFTVTVPPDVSAPVAYQWLRSDNGGAAWTNAAGTGATTNTYSFTVAAGDANAQFKCSISNPCGNDSSNAVNIGVCTAVSITGNPSPQNVTAGGTASFTAAATGVPAPSYQWQVSVDTGKTWTNVSLGGTAATYSFTTASTQNAYQYKCVVSNGCGPSVPTSAALLTVCTTPTISLQPVDPGTVIAGNLVSLSVSVVASGISPSYQWQKSPDGGVTWPNASGASATSATYSFTAVSGDSGALLRCNVFNWCGSVNSSFITMKVCTPVAVTSNPANQNVTAGQPAAFSVGASGSGPIYYQWEYSANNGTTWNNVLSGGTAFFYGFTSASAQNGYQYRCAISNGCGAATSGPATLTVCTPPSFTGPLVPPPFKNVGDTVTFAVSVPASVTSPLYQWQRSNDNGASWANAAGPTATTAAYSLIVAAGDIGAQFHCFVTNGCGAIVSNAVTIAVCSQAVITVQPAPQNVIAGQPATFAVTATAPSSVTYQWQFSVDTGKTWTNVDVATGGAAATYTFTTATSNNGWLFRVGVFTGCGVVNSSAASLTVCTPPSIAQQPASQTKMAGDIATFAVAVPAEATSPSYMWQRSPDGNTWTNATGTTATSAVYTFTVAAGDDSAHFRCAVSGPCGAITSGVAVLYICTPPAITAVPAPQSVTAGQIATFAVGAGGSAPLSYQWQSSVDGLTAWGNVPSGGTASTYSFTAATNENGWHYRCVVSGACGAAAVSAAAALSVCTPPFVVSQPGNQFKNLGDTATFGVTAQGSLLVYQWQRSANGATWANVTAGTGAATATYRLAAISSDDNALFRCMIQNGCGKDSSAPATLRVCSPVAIIGQPKDTSVVTGGTFTFRVAVSGSNPVYQWQNSVNGLVWNNDTIAPASAATYSRTARASDNGTKFRCFITSDCGDTTSLAAMLTVCDPVAITAQTIADATVIAGAAVSYGVTASGTAPAYSWQRKAAGDTAFYTLANATSASYSFTAQTADSGAQYRCMVSGACGAPAFSSVSHVVVYGKVRAAFGVSADAGLAPLTVTFYDSSSGNFSRRLWNFDDGAVDSASKNPTHVFTPARTYTVRLNCTGPGGADSASQQVFVYNPGANPVQITGAYVSPQTMQITLKGYGTITPPTPLVNADSVGLWYTVAVLPSSAGQAVFLKYYTPAALRARGATYTDTLTVPVLSGKDSVYGMMSGILWTDKTITAFDSGNGALVLMRDTMPIANPLLISGVYVPDDTARINLTNINFIDTSRVDTVGIWYSLSTNTANFKDTNATKWLSAADMVRAGAAYTLPIVNSQFNNAQTTMYAAVVLLGKNSRYSPVSSTSIIVGKQRPNNPIHHLVAKALTATTMQLNWNNVSATAIDRIIIWYRTTAPVPLAADVTSLNLDSLVPAVSDTTIVGNKFNAQTRYFFGAQVFQNGLWSLITDSSSATDSTPEAGDTLPYNSAQVKSIAFDTSFNEIKVRWTVSTTQEDSVPGLQVGILYSADSPPTVSTGEQQVVDVVSPSDSAYVMVRGNILFNHTYYLSLWLRRTGGAWTRPTAAGFDSVHVPAFTWQNVVYFTKQNDSVFAFNNQIRLLNSPGDSSVTHNTVYYYAPNPSTLAGFVTTGIGFDFKLNDGGVPFYVGLKVDTIPAGYTIKDVRIFHQTPSGAWLVDDNPVVIDTVLRYVSVFTNQLDYPFVAMIDTTHPRVSLQPGVNDSVVAGRQVTDTIVIRDHLSNVLWWFRAAKGGSALAAGDTSQFGALSDTLETVIVTAPGAQVSPDNGMRGILVLSDGTHMDTVDLSRSVVRDTEGVVRVEEQAWTPLSTAMVLDTQDARKVLTSFVDKGVWTYDNVKARLFRWLANAGNQKSDEKWVEYSDSGASQFRFARGNLLWIKTRDRTDVRFGRGITPSLKRPDTLALAPGNWTDFALPFNFDITLGDIFFATKTAGHSADSLQFYAWREDSAGRYRSEAKFISAIDSLSDPSMVFSATDVAGFSVYNPYKDTVALVVPPLPQAMSKVGIPKKAAASGGWAVQVVTALADGTPLTSVYCGYKKMKTADVSYYPQAPSLVKAYAGVFDTKSQQVHGHAIVHSTSDGGAAYLLVFGNETPQKLSMSYRVNNTQSLPKDMSIKLYNPSADKFDDLTGGSAAVAVDAGAKEFRWLFVGTASYLAKARLIAKPGILQFAGTYPNPFRTFVRIRYSLPYDGVDKIKFTIYDVRGRLVWQEQVAAGFSIGPSELSWNARSSDGRPVSAGVYIIRMAALAKTGKPAGVFERRMTLIR